MDSDGSIEAGNSGWWQTPDGKRYPPPANDAEAARMYNSMWQGTDGKWYAALEPTPAGSTPTGTPAGRASPGTPRGTVPSEIGTQPPLGYWPRGQHQPANGFAIAALVCSLLFLLVVPALLGIIFGFVALSQIHRSRANPQLMPAQKGDGLAISGILIGFIGLSLMLVAVAIPTFIGVRHTG